MLLVASAAGMLCTATPALSEPPAPRALAGAGPMPATLAPRPAARPAFVFIPNTPPPAAPSPPPAPAAPAAPPAVARAEAAPAPRPPTRTRANSTRAPRASRSSSRPPAPRRPAYTAVAYTAATGDVGAVIAAAMSYQGTRYVWGSASHAGVDCSGLTMLAYRAVGISLPHNAAAQGRTGHAVAWADARAGDVLIFYGGAHAALYLGNGMMISASKPGVPVRVSKVWDRPSAVRRLIG